MDVTVSQAVHQLQDLVRRAQAGEDVVLIEDGRPAVKLVPVPRKRWAEMTLEERELLLRDISERGRAKATPGPDAAHAADFLYDENGLPA